MFKCLVLALGAALSLALVSVSGDPVSGNSGDSEKFAVDLITSQGVHYKFPYFRGVRKMDDVYAITMREDAEELMLYLNGLVSEMLVPTERASEYGWTSVISNMYSMAKRPAGTVKKMCKTTTYTGPFLTYATKFMQFTLNRSYDVEKNLKKAKAPKDKVKLRDDISKMILSLNEAIKFSPVVFLFDWAEGTVDGRWVEEAFPEIMGRLRYHGYGNVLWITEKFMSIVLGLSKLG